MNREYSGSKVAVLNKKSMKSPDSFYLGVDNGNRGEIYDLVYNMNRMVGSVLMPNADNKVTGIEVKSKDKIVIYLENGEPRSLAGQVKSVVGVLKQYRNKR